METFTSRSSKPPNEYKICRICVDEKSKIRPISEVTIDYENVKLSLKDVLSYFTGQRIINAPFHYICDSCTEKAELSYNFKISCEESTKRFENHLETYVSSNQMKVEEAENCSDDDKPLINFANDGCSSSDGDLEKKLLKTCESDQNENEIKREMRLNSSKQDKKQDEFLKFEITACKFCKKLFKNKYVLSAHEKRHENKGKFICNECGKGFDSKGCLSRHTRVHTGERKFQCEECQRCFPSANNLRLHSRRHNGIKPYLCIHCGKSFSHPTGLSYHLRTHTKERPHTCEICGKSFLIQCHLDRHKMIHTGERPFACTQCERAFIKKIDLQRHEAIHSGEKPYICKICNKSFLRVLHLNYHMMVHTSERPHRCTYCGKGFIRRYYLTDHMKKRHSEDLREHTSI